MAKCREAQGQFRYYWRPGTQNLADYFTKHHPATHHKNVRPTILTSVNDPEYRKLFATQTTQPPKCEATQTSGGFEYAHKRGQTSFVKTLLKTPKFQHLIAARSA